MHLDHTRPCDECPWRKTAPEGWLGGDLMTRAVFYTDAVAAGEVPACHKKDHGPNHPDTAFCAGALSVMANMCMNPYKQTGASDAVRMVGKNPGTFSHPAFFYRYHTGKAWIHPLMRD